MSFDMTRLRRFNPDEELTQQEIKDLPEQQDSHTQSTAFKRTSKEEVRTQPA